MAPIGNPIGDTPGFVWSPVPSVLSDPSSRLKDATGRDSAKREAVGQHKLGNANGPTVAGEAGKEKTAKNVEQEPRNAEQNIFREKTARQQQAAATAPSPKAMGMEAIQPKAPNSPDPKKLETKRF